MLILASLATFMQMMRKIRESKLQIESAIFWMILAMVLVVFSVFPPVADFIAHCLGIYSTAIFLLIMKEFRMTIHISQLETRVKELVQRMALEEKLREEHERQRLQEERNDKRHDKGYEEQNL